MEFVKLEQLIELLVNQLTGKRIQSVYRNFWFSLL